jgi:hypothetical protein
MKFVVAAVLSLSMSQAHAGGITGGGGGVTNPDPIQPEAIARLVQNESKPVLLSWLNSQEEKFQQLSRAEQSASPYRKLFAQTPNIFDVMEQAGVDLEMHQPCFDLNRETRDGSVHSHTPGFVCLSPFTMAPKLDESNYVAETMALVLHELTHKLGTTEDEATLMQKEALKVFRKVDLEEFAKRSQSAESSARFHASTFERFIQTPESFQAQTAAPAVERLSNYIGELSLSATSRYSSRLSLVRPDTYARILSNMLRVNLASNYLVLKSPTTPTTIRDSIQQTMDRAFGTANEITARTYLTAGLGNSGFKGDVFDQEILQKVTSDEQIPQQLAKVRDVMAATARELAKSQQARFKTN